MTVGEGDLLQVPRKGGSLLWIGRTIMMMISKMPLQSVPVCKLWNGRVLKLAMHPYSKLHAFDVGNLAV